MVIETKVPQNVKSLRPVLVCGKSSLTVTTPENDEHLIRYRCHSWNCEWCRGRRIEDLVERIHDVDVSQYIEIESNCDYQTFRAAWSKWTKLVKRQRKHFTYLLVLRGYNWGLQAGLFICGKPLPASAVARDLARYGVQARIHDETLYRPGAKEERLVRILDQFTNEHSYIHRVRGSRDFFTHPRQLPERQPGTRVTVSPVPFDTLLYHYASRGYQIERVDDDHYIVRGGALPEPPARTRAGPDAV